MQVKGVNLGNWLVLEKWMSPGLFEGTTAEDEHNLPLQLPKEVYEARMKMHRAEYITERDFTRIRSIGMNAVRIPVPYFIFGDREPFIGCIEELDKAFNWAEKYGLQILIDLHTAPGSQNGFDNGGESGVCIWSQDPDEVEFELTSKLYDSDYLLGVYDETRMGGIRLKLDPDGPFLSDDRETAAPPWTTLRTLEEASRNFESDESGLPEKWLNQLIKPGSGQAGTFCFCHDSSGKNRWGICG